MAAKTLIEAIEQKYAPHEEEFANIYVPKSMPGIDDKGEVVIPKHFVMEYCDITHAGDENLLAAKCGAVTELDLGGNLIAQWQELFKILRVMPNLTFLNLTENPLGRCSDGPVNHACQCLSGIKQLILNKTLVSWSNVEILLSDMPSVTDVYLNANEYDFLPVSDFQHPGIQTLYFNSNPITSWKHVLALGRAFPNLRNLILAQTPFSEIDISEDEASRAFPHLQSINLSDCRIQHWRHIEKLNWFPSLTDIRMKSLPLYQKYKDEVLYRQLCIAFLPKVDKLNGSSVKFDERDKAERAFIRYFVKKEKQPARLAELQSQHGELQELVDIDLAPVKSAHVLIRWEEKQWTGPISVEQTVKQLKAFIRRTFGIAGDARFQVWYVDPEAINGHELLPYPGRILHAIGVKDGDSFNVFVI